MGRSKEYFAEINMCTCPPGEYCNKACYEFEREQDTEDKDLFE